MLKLVYSQKEVLLNKSIIFNTLFKALPPCKVFSYLNRVVVFVMLLSPLFLTLQIILHIYFNFSASVLALFESSLPNIQSNDKIDQINIFVHNCIKKYTKEKIALSQLSKRELFLLSTYYLRLIVI
ncbi:hypothetical protein BK751_22280 [Bacillus thuringiensis serovar galleriae]|uniref:Uncharacterized protein n=4 Tax=Bacillus cereus group TaxID=86661 RepID=A0A643MK92_BACTU|nr:hypothetical protein BG08_2393 [Bacillus thuringiensis serovar kurstaki]EJQ19881.1 hypothetical protein IE5_03198 [Bacillus cereus BAG3X2-2]EJV90078.1 hypothetical protein IG1_01455 [Bacillus cereus HD73]EOP27988.1 hypothetical protein IGG_04218 [Bacillus cereus HuB13-1]EOP65101.1 hypothetical protein IGU_03815 [Bacillus cereus ISP2954]EOP97195.1 hypothetical protein IES_01821 [Bacillus cereus BMG1.7]KAB1360024.1 hypothetical protein FPG90_03710 [Bacillus thuringiensis]OPA34671.1 hypothet